MQTTLIISKEVNAFQLITDAGQYTFEVNSSKGLNDALYTLQGIFAQTGIFAKNYGGAKLLACQALANATPCDDKESLEGVTVAVCDVETFDKALQLVVGKFASTAIISRNISGAKKIADAVLAWKVANE